MNRDFFIRPSLVLGRTLTIRGGVSGAHVIAVMSYFPDLTPFTYGGAEPDPAILNVGWLNFDHEMPVAEPNELFLSALRKAAAEPVNLYRGCHLCDFCPRPPMTLSSGGMPMLQARPETMGNGEIWVKGSDGFTYVAPALILHYVSEHHYAPPKVFVDAIIACR
ncbi:hypothetical protein GCM10010994_58040 [Chelatococcus reniformis]|uniref:DUF7919 domain-containing protein n=1 Tax=Chelatococcus reniformis TaxID=1494448 RepID=A0A916XQK1_9HYPH|nr:hypothetical protein GCM10010994_58040 [Chelatococcus reniformis]